MNDNHYDADIAYFEPISDAYILCLTLGLDNHLNAMSLTSWESPRAAVEAVEISSVSL